MLIIIDQRIPDQAKQQLCDYGQLIQLAPSDNLEASVAAHPDIHLAQLDNSLVVSPDSPQSLFDALDYKNINYYKGTTPFSKEYPQIAAYNAVATEQYFIHKLNITDAVIQEKTKEKIRISVNQGFTRCSLVALPNNDFITSDKGIYAALLPIARNILYLDPQNIQLPEQDYGFIGGCIGFYDNTVFLLGDIHYHKEGEKLGNFIKAAGLNLIQLYSGPLFDGGSIFFV